MTTYAEDEASVESSQPREAIEIRVNLLSVHRIATGTRDIVINGQTYTAGPSAREEVKLATSENQTDLVIRLPMKHAVPRRWLSLGSPPKVVTVDVYRAQLVSGGYERIWNGYVTSLSATDNNAVALLRVPSRATAMLDRRLPSTTVGRGCPHLLYDRNCRVDRAGFTQNATVTDVQGRQIKVSTMGAHPDDWATFGELLHVSTGERMTVSSQIGTTITMQAAIAEIVVGDAVQVFAGCPHDITSCNSIFSNRVNFGGFPHLNTVNPVAPTGFGIYASS